MPRTPLNPLYRARAWLRLAALLPILLPAALQAGPAAPGTAYATLEVRRPASPVPLEPGLIGLNSPMGALSRPRGRYDSGEMATALETLPLGALRFPGGTVANYFDWDSGSLIEPALARSGKTRLLDTQVRHRAEHGGKLPAVDFDSFHRFTDRHGLRRFVVLNLLSSPVDNTLQVIDRIKQHHPGRYYWELGNELSQGAYRKRAYATEKWNALVYAGLSEQITDHIRKRYPEDRVGVVTGQLVEGRVPAVPGLRRIQQERTHWDRVATGIEGADAVIIHPYVIWEQPYSGRVLSAARDTQRVMPLSSREEEIAWRWIFACAQELPGRYRSRLAERYPGRAIWITEAGLSEDRKSGGVADLRQSMRRVLFNTAYLVSWLRHYPDLEVFLFHGLFAGEGHMAAFGRGMAWNANTAALAYLRAALRDGHALEVLEFPSGPGYPGVADYADTRVGAVSGLYVEKAGGDAILLINTGKQAVSLAHPFARVSGRYLGGRADGRVPGPSAGALPGASFEVPDSGPVELPPFSVMLIEER